MSARWISFVPPPGASTASVSVVSSAGLSAIRFSASATRAVLTGFIR